MAFYADLSHLAYFGEENADGLLAVGWLERSQDYAHGSVEKDFFRKLVELLVDPWQPVRAMGFHECSFCHFTGGPRHLSHEGTTVQLGAANLFVPADGTLYAAPSLIAHYVDAHDYAPPTGFCEAVLSCPPMRSMAYLRALRQNGPKGLIRGGIPRASSRT